MNHLIKVIAETVSDTVVCTGKNHRRNGNGMVLTFENADGKKYIWFTQANGQNVGLVQQGDTVHIDASVKGMYQDFVNLGRVRVRATNDYKIKQRNTERPQNMDNVNNNDNVEELKIGQTVDDYFTIMSIKTYDKSKYIILRDKQMRKYVWPIVNTDKFDVALNNGDNVHLSATIHELNKYNQYVLWYVNLLDNARNLIIYHNNGGDGGYHGKRRLQQDKVQQNNFSVGDTLDNLTVKCVMIRQGFKARRGNSTYDVLSFQYNDDKFTVFAQPDTYNVSEGSECTLSGVINRRDDRYHAWIVSKAKINNVASGEVEENNQPQEEVEEKGKTQKNLSFSDLATINDEVGNKVYLRNGIDVRERERPLVILDDGTVLWGKVGGTHRMVMNKYQKDNKKDEAEQQWYRPDKESMEKFYGFHHVALASYCRGVVCVMEDMLGKSESEIITALSNQNKYPVDKIYMNISWNQKFKRIK